MPSLLFDTKPQNSSEGASSSSSAVKKTTHNLGEVVIIGVGRGGIETLNKAAKFLISHATAVVADYGVKDSVLDLVSGELHTSSDEADDRSLSHVVIEAAQRGRDVVRLRAQDPFHLSRGGNEADSLRRNGVEPILVPGLSSDIAVAGANGKVASIRQWEQLVGEIFSSQLSHNIVHGGDASSSANRHPNVSKVLNFVSDILKGSAQPSPAPLFQGVISNSSAPAVNLEKSNDSVANLHAILKLSDVDKNSSSLIGLLDGYSAARYIGAAVSDILYDFTAAESGFFTNVREAYADASLDNIHGRSAKVLFSDTRAGCGDLVTGSLRNGLQVSSMIDSDALVHMSPSIFELSNARSSTVFHVASRAVSDELTLAADMTALQALHAVQCVMLGSNSPQEVHDMALVSHLLSSRVSLPVLHFFDGSRTARTATRVKLLSHSQISSVTKDLFVNQSSVPEQLDAVFEHVQGVVGHRYKLFEYEGPSNAESVIVYIGTAASSCLTGEPVARLGDGSVGLLHVRLLRPWSARHLLQALPATTKRITVFAHSSVCSRLLADVAGAFYSGSWASHIPVIYSAPFDTSLPPPNALQAIIAAMIIAKPRGRIAFSIDVQPASVSERPPQIQCQIWSTPEFDAAADGIARVLLRSDSSFRASSNQDVMITADGASHTVKTTTVVVAHPNVVLHNQEVEHDFVACFDASILLKYDVAASIKNGGTLILNAPWKIDQVESSIPTSVRNHVQSRGIRIFVFNAAQLAVDNELDSPITVLMAAFFKYSPATTEIVSGSSRSGHIAALIKKAKLKNTAQYNPIMQSLSNKTALNPDTQAGTEASTLPLSVASKVVPSKSLRHAVSSEGLLKSYTAAWYLTFPEAFGLDRKLRPDIKGASQVTVAVNKRLTPANYDRNVFHMEMDTRGEVKYEIGEALAVHGHNDSREVERFLKFYKLKNDDLVQMNFKNAEPGQFHIRTVEQVFTQYLDLFGRPSKKFYEALAPYATNAEEKKVLSLLATAEGQEEFKKRVDHTITFAEILEEFSSAHPGVDVLLQIIPPLKARHYSIASSMKMHPESVHLLVVLVNWQTPKGSERFGHCTRYLAGAHIGDTLTVSVKPSVMTLPPLNSQPIIMAGLGTGMAPFRAFIQERAFLKAQGVEVGPIVLYFGSRSRFSEYLYGEELEVYYQEGLLTHLQLAFSRDQNEKIYIQHKISEDAKILHDLMLNKQGHFYLCGPTWPEPDVRDAILNSFQTEGGLTLKDAASALEQLKEDEKYILELY